LVKRWRNAILCLLFIKKKERKYEGDKSTVATKLSHEKKKKKDKALQNISMVQSP
jgi:hypothetical protein